MFTMNVTSTTYLHFLSFSLQASSSVRLTLFGSSTAHDACSRTWKKHCQLKTICKFGASAYSSQVSMGRQEVDVSRTAKTGTPASIQQSEIFISPTKGPALKCTVSGLRE